MTLSEPQFWKGSEDLRLRIEMSSQTSHSKQPVLVFLHDALGSLPQWKKFPQDLAAQLGLDYLIYERAGHGQSSPLGQTRTRDYMHYEAWEVLPKLLLDLGIKKPILIGHSDGGSIALLYASRYACEMLVTVAAHYFVEEITLKGIEQAYLMRAKIKEGLRKHHGAKTEALFNAWYDTWTADWFRDWNIKEDIQEIRCPSLIIQGTNDSYGSYKQVEGIWNAVRGIAAEVILPHTGHMPHLENPRELSDTIQTFIKSQLDID